jgi:alpha-galactosidase
MLQVGLMGFPNQQNKEFQPTNLSTDEQYTQMSLWCLLSAPLLLSCHIKSMDEFTLNLLSNDEVLAVNQDPVGQPAFRVSRRQKREVWAKHLEDGSIAVGLFNRSKRKRTVKLFWEELGLVGPHQARDLWHQQDLGSFTESFAAEVNPHGVVFIKLSKEMI